MGLCAMTSVRLVGLFWLALALLPWFRQVVALLVCCFIPYIATCAYLVVWLGWDVVRQRRRWCPRLFMRHAHPRLCPVFCNSPRPVPGTRHCVVRG